jgi:DNA-binding NarL/FixJ family response regulator
MTLSGGRLTREDLRSIAEMEHDLAVWSDGESPLAHGVTLLRELTRSRSTCAYNLVERGTGFQVGFLHGDGVPEGKTRAMLDGVLRESKRRYGFFDPDRPEPSQRNRALTFAQLAARGSVPQDSSAIGRAKTVGVDMTEQLRILVCDGPALLSLVAVYRPEPWTLRERAILQRLVPALRRRLVLDRTLAAAPLAFAALDAAMEAIASAAFLVTEGGDVVQSNAAGRAAIGARSGDVRRALLEAIAASARGRESLTFQLTRVVTTGSPVHLLAVARAAATTRDLAVSAAARWGLSPRQANVLSWLVEGATNARIGAELGISERTVEVHVTAILARAQCLTRASLIVAVLRTH